MRIQDARRVLEELKRLKESTGQDWRFNFKELVEQYELMIPTKDPRLHLLKLKLRTILNDDKFWAIEVVSKRGEVIWMDSVENLRHAAKKGMGKLERDHYIRFDKESK